MTSDLWQSIAVLSGGGFSSRVAGEKNSEWINFSEILAFSPALKGGGVPQSWCLILAPFVSSALLQENPVLWSVQQPQGRLQCETAPAQVLWPVTLNVCPVMFFLFLFIFQVDFVEVVYFQKILIQLPVSTQQRKHIWICSKVLLKIQESFGTT